jgi:preprotein translocase subunit Sss1
MWRFDPDRDEYTTIVNITLAILWVLFFGLSILTWLFG